MSFPLMPCPQVHLQSGLVWSAITPPTAGNMRYTAVNTSGIWAVAGPSGAVYRSSDYGNTWASATPSTGQMYGMAYGDGLFAVTQDGGDNLYTSADGSTWTARISGASRDHHQVKYNDGYFVLGSGTGGGDGYIYGSANGLSWTYGPQGAVGANSVWCGIYVSSLGRTMAGGIQYKYNNAAPTSATAWAGTPAGLSGTTLDIAWSPVANCAVIAGTSGLFYSSNLSGWTLVSPGSMYGVAWCVDKFVAVGAGGMIQTSTDGITWTSRTSGTANDLYGVSEYNGVILVTGNNGTVLRSSGS